MTQTTIPQMPLWLDIKTEYIDENFEKVLDYLNKGSRVSAVRDSFFNKTLELLEQRVVLLLENIAVRPVYEDEELALDKDTFKFHTRLLASYLLVNPQLDEQYRRRIQVTMLSSLSNLVPENYSQDLIEMAVKVLLGKIESKLSFSWQDIIEFNSQILAHKIINSTKAESKKTEQYSYSNKGILNLEKGTLTIAATSKDKTQNVALVPSIAIFDNQIQVLSKKDDKVKKSESANLEKLDEFTRDFISEQRKVTVIKNNKPTLSYSQGDSFKAVVTGFGSNKIEVESIDPKYDRFTGVVDCSQSLLYYDYIDFKKYLPVGEVIRVELSDYRNSICRIDDEFVHYIIDEVAEEDFGHEVLAKYVDDNTDRKGVQKIVWLTDTGYPAYSFYSDDVKRDDFAIIKICNHGKDKYYGYINAEVKCKAEDSFDVESVRQKCIEGFSYGPLEDKKTDSNTVSSGVIKELCRMLVSYQRGLTMPSERYKILCVARFLAEITGNISDSNYIHFIADYLEDLVLFAKGDIEKMQDLVPDIEVSDLESVRRRISIVSILKSYGVDANNDKLSEVIVNEKDELLRKIAILVQSCNRIDDVISKSMQNVIKREIIKSLAIETEGDTDLEEENGIYLGIENSRQEFKTSFFHAPANAKEQNQRINVFKGVCAFLNSQAGGTLFLGVDDLGYVKGIDNDIEYMERTVSGNYHGIDGYVRYITDEAKKYFDLGILTHIRIEVMYEGKVVALNVQPYEYKVVSLEGISYIRLNNESVVMTEAAKRQLMDRRIFATKEKTANVSVILEAIKDKRKVIFHNYSSSNSGEIRDRSIEPFAFTTGYSHVWCYDLDKGRNSVFGTERIGNVEILEEHWEKEHLHRQDKIDVFHMTGDTPIHAVLQLDLMAKNLLCEEYPDAKSSLVSTGDNNRWILDLDVYRIQGLGRFYMGLAGNIEILDCPELEAYVKDYTEKHLH